MTGKSVALVEPLLCLALAAKLHGADRSVRRAALKSFKRHPAQTWLLAVATAPKALALVQQVLADLE